MGIAKLKKIRIFVPTGKLEPLKEKLAELSFLHISDLNLKKDDSVFSGLAVIPGETADIDDSLQKIDRAIAGIELYGEPGAGKKTARHAVKQSEFAETLSSFSFGAAYRKLDALFSEAERINTLMDELVREKKNWEPLRFFNYPLSSLLFPGLKVRFLTVAASYAPELAGILESAAEGLLEIETVSSVKGESLLLLIYPDRIEQAVAEAVASSDAVSVTPPPINTPPSDRIREIDATIADLAAKKIDVISEIRSFSSEKTKLMIIYDYFYNLKMNKELDGKLLATERVAVLEGWIAEKNMLKLDSELRKGFSFCEAVYSDPEPGDNVPVIMENNGLTKPFSLLTLLYSVQAYDEIDPTPYVMPFFTIFYGFCMSDAAYGVTLTLLSYLGYRYLKGEAVKKFFKLFMYCGVSTFVFGILMGGWLGLSVAQAPGFLQSADGKKFIGQIFDPMKDPLVLINIALVLGFIQSFIGLVLAFAKDLKNKNYIMAWGLRLPWLVFAPSFMLIAVGFINKGLTVSYPFLMKGNLYAFGLSGIVVAIFGGWHIKSIPERIIFSILEVYGVVGFLSDVLSYLRLFALGLATGAIGAAINEVVKLFADIPVVGFAVMGVAFAVAHLANLVINCLGAFVHSLRLQFVEFFRRFFTGGGEEFRAFGKRYRYIEIIKE